MNDIASKYYYNQNQEAVAKEKKKNNTITYRKKNRFIPNVMLINNINRMGRVNTKQVSPLYNKSKSNRIKMSNKVITPTKKEKPFVYRQPNIAFRIETVMGGISNTVGGIESFVSIKPKKDVVNITNLTKNNSIPKNNIMSNFASNDNIMGNNKFEFNLDGILLKKSKKK
jgi:hypothetical protein